MTACVRACTHLSAYASVRALSFRSLARSLEHGAVSVSRTRIRIKMTDRRRFFSRAHLTGLLSCTDTPAKRWYTRLLLDLGQVRAHRTRMIELPSVRPQRCLLCEQARKIRTDGNKRSRCVRNSYQS